MRAARLPLTYADSCESLELESTRSLFTEYLYSSDAAVDQSSSTSVSFIRDRI